jgi:hypothetical protein
MLPEPLTHDMSCASVIPCDPSSTLQDERNDFSFAYRGAEQPSIGPSLWLRRRESKDAMSRAFAAELGPGANSGRAEGGRRLAPRS